MIRIRVLQFATLCCVALASISAFAQSNPNFSAGQALPAASLNALGVDKADVANTTATVATNAALKALPAGQFNTVYRQGFYSAGDGGAATYHWSSSGCAISGGDNGSQVAPLSGTGCLIWDPMAQRITPMIFGAAGTGSSGTDDTSAVQAAITAAASAGVPLWFDTNHLYNIKSGLNVTSPIDIEGPLHYGFWTTTATNSRSCSWGLTNTAYGATTMLNVSAVTATIRGICIDMTAGNGGVNPTAGAAIKLAPPSTSTYQTGVVIQDNTILNPYDGITLDGAGYSSACCGQGATADGNAIIHNTIVNPTDVGISNGRYTANAASPGNTLTDNIIGCINSASKATGVGVALFDGAIYYDGTQNGPEGCNIGVLISPGNAGGQSQNAEFNGDGVMGDQSTTHDFYVHPTGSGIVDFVTVGGKGAWAAAGTNVSSVDIDCTGTSVSCQEFNFTGVTVHGGNGQAQPIFQVNSGPGGPYDLSIVGSNICQFETPGSGSTALSLSIPTVAKSIAGRFTITGNRIGNGCPGGANATGINLSIGASSGGGANGMVLIANNDISGPSTPIVYTPNATGNVDNVIIHDNLGIDNTSGATASASTIDIGSQYAYVGLSGSTSVNNIQGFWQNRHIFLTPISSSITFTTPSLNTNGGNICNTVVVAPNTMTEFTYNAGANDGCWSAFQVQNTSYTYNFVTATGSSQSNAASITSQYTILGETGSGQGVILPTPPFASTFNILNENSIPINIYPPVGSYFVGMSVNSPYSLGASSSITLNFYTGGNWAVH